MGQYEERLKLLEKYYTGIQSSYGFEMKGNIAARKMENAIKKFAPDLDRESVLGFYDTTVTGNGKNGYIFTDTMVYYLEILDTPRKLRYEDIEDVELIDMGKKDGDNKLRFQMRDGSEVIWTNCGLNKTPLYHFFKDLLDCGDAASAGTKEQVSHEESRKYEGAVAGGIAVAAHGQVNKSYEEEKFHGRQGHGFAAERANTLYDRLTGHDAKIVGDDNIKNGADRIVDGVAIQSKYCKSGSACVNECFDKEGNFRYWVDGKPMQIEVPSDKYDAAVKAMEEKIREGKMPGITDPEEAKNIVRKGHFTYEQAKNIANQVLNSNMLTF